jgi:hypothetical protein
MQTLDIYGYLAICCTTNGDLIVRHNRIRDLVDKIAREGHLSPIMEKKGILGESKNPGRRPGDVTIPLWCEGKGLCVDVAITCPFSASNLSRDSPAEYCATHLKHRKYDADFKGSPFDFSALLFESTGGVNREGKEFLAQLFRFAARYSGTHLSVYAGRAWARLSCTLQSAVAQSVINRLPDSDPSAPSLFSDDTETPVSSFSLATHEVDSVSSPGPVSLLRVVAPPFVPLSRVAGPVSEETTRSGVVVPPGSARPFPAVVVCGVLCCHLS